MLRRGLHEWLPSLNIPDEAQSGFGIDVNQIYSL